MAMFSPRDEVIICRTGEKFAHEDIGVITHFDGGWYRVVLSSNAAVVWCTKDELCPTGAVVDLPDDMLTGRKRRPTYRFVTYVLKGTCYAGT
jgi:hypothetical protein